MQIYCKKDKVIRDINWILQMRLKKIQKSRVKGKIDKYRKKEKKKKKQILC